MSEGLSNTPVPVEDTTTKKEDYRIEICQDGKFAVTFDTANLRIKILENTDQRPFMFNKKKIDSNNKCESDEPDTIDKTIAYFKINNNFDIDKFYSTNYKPPSFKKPKLNANNSNNFLSVNDNGACSSDTEQTTSENKENNSNDDDDDNDKFRWSFDISNMHKKNDEYFILVAISCININEDMKGINYDSTKIDYKKEYLSERKFIYQSSPDENVNEVTINVPTEPEKFNYSDNNISESNNEIRKGIAIYRIELRKSNGNYNLCAVTRYFSNSVSGVCRFIEVSGENEEMYKLKRFIILNFRGIYNFEFNNRCDFFNLNEKFEYPHIVRRELNNWYRSNTGNDCMDRLSSYTYDKYFLVTLYKNYIQSLEVYDLEKMKLKIDAKKVENKDEFAKQSNYDTFTVGKLEFCFTRGTNRIKLCYIENGLQATSKKFDEIEKIYLLEFIDSDEKLFIIGENSEKEVVFIIWDLYDTGKFKSTTLDNFPITYIMNHGTRLARTSGNILQVDDDGTVSSVLKRVKRELKQKKENDKKKRENNKKKKEELDKVYYGIKPNGELDMRHNIHCDHENNNFKPIVYDKEPWVLGNYERNSYCLYQSKEGTETIQLFVGRSTVQIWHQIRDKSKSKDKLPNKGEPFLEYIWTNRIPVNQECKDTRLQVERFEYGMSDELHDKLTDFSLKIYWRIGEDEKREKVIKRKDIIETCHVVRHACKALEHLNKRYKNNYFLDNYKTHQYEKMITYIEYIVWRFANNEPENFELLDARYNIIKSLILGDCDHLIKFILFGDDENGYGKERKEKEEKEKENKEKEEKENKEKEEKEEGKKENAKKQDEVNIRHIPTNLLWPGKKFLNDDDLDFDERKNELKDNEKIKPENSMELAIYHCKGRELKDTIIVAYLLEYYSRHATDCVGWMCTVSRAIPLLFKYNYDDYVRELFIKECFIDQDHFSGQNPDDIIPEEYQERHNHNIKFKAFRPKIELSSDRRKTYDRILTMLKYYKNKIVKMFENLDNNLGKSPLALRVVPLPCFTKNKIPTKKVEYDFIKIVWNIFLFVFIPRWYRIGYKEKVKLSPFSRMILYENNDEIYDNPATEAVINFRWQKARNFFLFLFIRFLIFAICFVLISWTYLRHGTFIGEKFLFALIVIFYYLAIYQLVTEALQLFYRGLKKYFGEIFNSFDIISIVLSVIIMTIMLKNYRISDGFESVETTDTELIVGISFSIFILWIELILYLRIISNIGAYIYYVGIILRTIFPFLLFMSIVILAFTHTMFVLLSNPMNIKTKYSTYSGVATNPLTNETLSNIKFKTDFDPVSSDNPFSSFSTALLAAYFWINGNWVQRDKFDYWAVDVLTLFASIFLVILLQNLLIAFMSGVYQKAEIKGKLTLLRHRAKLIADYEALYHIHFWDQKPETKHIYYFGQSKNIEEWYYSRKKDDKDAIYKGFEEKSTFIKHTYRESNYAEFSICQFGNGIKGI